jgi:hypothetical protein
MVDQVVGLVESYYDRGKRKKSRTIANLLAEEVLAPHLEWLVELFKGGSPSKDDGEAGRRNGRRFGDRYSWPGFFFKRTWGLL